MKCPKQVLWAAFLGEEGFSDEEIPNDLNGDGYSGGGGGGMKGSKYDY
jgi:hypothetical protein